MALHAQRQRVAAQKTDKRILRAHDRTHVAHQLGAAFVRKGCRGQIGVDETVITLVGFVNET